MVGGIHRRPVLLNRKRKVGFASLHSSTVVDDIVDGREETQGFSSSSTRSIDTRKEEIKKTTEMKELAAASPRTFAMFFSFRILVQNTEPRGRKSSKCYTRSSSQRMPGRILFFSFFSRFSLIPLASDIYSGRV